MAPGSSSRNDRALREFRAQNRQRTRRASHDLVWSDLGDGRRPIRHNSSVCNYLLVEAAGIEPATAAKTKSTTLGRSEASCGHDETQVGQGQEVAVGPGVEGRTVAGPAESHLGRETSITGAQLSPRRSEASVGADPDLDLVLSAWGELPERARQLVAKLVATLRGSASTDAT